VPGPVFADTAATYSTWFVSTGPIPAN
jgi:hypothetical protein